MTIEDIMADGDKVVVRATLNSTHRGSALPMFAGIEPKGRPVEWQFIHIYRMRDGKIAKHWAQTKDLAVRMRLAKP
jgi:lactoylglutathione lyase